MTTTTALGKCERAFPRLGALAMGSLLLAGGLFAGKEKPWTAWTQKDATKVLREHTVHRKKTTNPSDSWLKTNEPQTPMERERDRSSVNRANSVSESMRKYDREVTDGRTEKSGPAKEILEWSVTWTSTTRARQATARLKELAGELDTRQAADFASARPEFIELAVRVVYHTGGDWDGLWALEYARLLLDGSKVQILPVRTQVKHNYDRNAVQHEVDMILFFPREIDGKPTIQSTGKKAEFIWPFARYPADKIKASFNLRKLANGQVGDL